MDMDRRVQSGPFKEKQATAGAPDRKRDLTSHSGIRMPAAGCTNTSIGSKAGIHRSFRESHDRQAKRQEINEQEMKIHGSWGVNADLRRRTGGHPCLIAGIP